MQISDEQLLMLMDQMKLETSTSRLQDFPWSQLKYLDLMNLIKDRKILPAVLFDPDARHTILSRKEKLISDIIGNLIFIIPILFIAAAIWTREWSLLLGTPCFLIALFVSNPWARKFRRLLIVVSLIIIIFAIVINYIVVAFIFAGLVMSLFLSVFAREYVNEIVKREIIKSEPLFCYTFQTGLLILKDANTGKIYSMGQSTRI